MINEKKFFSFFVFILLVFVAYSQDEIIQYKCGEYSNKPEPIKASLTLAKETIKRKLDNNGFKEFNIGLDTKNLEKEMEIYKITKYKNIFFDAMNQAIETLKSLLKVKPSKCYILSATTYDNLGFKYWDKKKYGVNESNQQFNLCYSNLDLLIVGKFLNSSEIGSKSTLASAGALAISPLNGQPLSGFVYINRDINYSKKNAKEYFKSIIIHEFTHILGFSNYFFINIFHNIFTQKNQYGVTHSYINSPKVLEVAKKYFNCPTIKGVPLEDAGGKGTVGSHWEARILLGDYMNGGIYTPEQVISEFTLALLEDTGYYKANYYTGGLMRYGKNKGCKFVNEKCIVNQRIDKSFENEFYDFYNSKTNIRTSCSSGRLSRAYFYVRSYSEKIPSSYQYYKNGTYGGYPHADYCPVPVIFAQEEESGYYVGSCSKKGFGDYGKYIYYNSNPNIYLSKNLEAINGEIYSDHSFCYLSSLSKKNAKNNEIISKVVRGVCYETFCSSKSLTLKIHDNYIVCPRAGGKVQIDGYLGFLMCPDYNLMCSGTTICNDMFDCVNKKSIIKSDSYNYDYAIKTSQNINTITNDSIEGQANYEISSDGICPINCKLCKENKKCLKCRNNYYFVNNNNKNCVHISQISPIDEYYLSEDKSTYYSCNNINYNSIQNCKKCKSKNTCTLCNNGFAFVNGNKNKCYKIADLGNKYYKDPKDNSNYMSCSKIDGKCLTCSSSKVCTSCNKGYGLYKDKSKCVDTSIKSYFKKNNLYYLCNDGVKYCKTCNSEKSCIQCISSYTLINNNKNQCHLKKSLGDKYYQDPKNSNNYLKCSNLVKKCLTCNQSRCKTCEKGYIFINGNYNACKLKSSINLKNYFTNDNIMYYNCKDNKYKNNSKCKNKKL